MSGANLALSAFDLEEFEDLAAEFAVPQDEALDLPVTDDDFDVQRALDEIKEPETRRGDVWQLGRRRLVCGDATNPDDVALLMDRAKAALVVTDPPYNVAVESTSARLAADGRGSIMNDNMPAEDFAGFLHAVFSNYAVMMQPTAAIYVFHPSTYQREFEDAMNAVASSSGHNASGLRMQPPSAGHSTASNMSRSIMPTWKGNPLLGTVIGHRQRYGRLAYLLRTHSPRQYGRSHGAM
ncbi:hypothetical protein ACLMCB_12220 [Paenibacillus sp. S29]|uniref:hypothetical protein n=1 Tax=Paenibacillus polymyxa TaxID=1406 RepID=UPI002B409EC5|nr:hypothetical protein [Paenibacillus polymyxa]